VRWCRRRRALKKEGEEEMDKRKGEAKKVRRYGGKLKKQKKK
jgi:hypothetical protein